MKRKLYQLIITQRNAHIFSVYLFSPIRLDEFFEVGNVGRRTFAARITYDFTDIFAHTVEDPVKCRRTDLCSAPAWAMAALKLSGHASLDAPGVMSAPSQSLPCT